MVTSAIKNLKEKKGSSLPAIKKYLAANYKVDAAKLAPFIRKFLKAAVAKGTLVQTNGSGASGHFKLAAEAKAVKKAVPKKKPAAKKTAPGTPGKKRKSAPKKAKSSSEPAAKKAKTASAVKPKAAKPTKSPAKAKKAPATKAKPPKAKKTPVKKLPHNTSNSLTRLQISR
ncbi:histone H1A, sperm-like [Daktulosphaira vitifoliae]|uniref:histone H1A, sperm-like n=1 Tax=Daktulosphaira vitifoliae TaxID=58002 RepID=UPI0021A9EF93|nr:histone H1A, sperm-like [Daktulosphaira vitifoliae]